jgi:putative queuosine salvage protein
MTNHPDALREAVTAITQRATEVSVVDRPAARYGGYLAELARQPPLDSGLMSVGDEETRVSFVILRDAINFGSGYHPYLAKTGGLSGARTIGTLLAARVRADGIPSAETLAEITPVRCAEMFRQPAGGPPYELMAMFAAAWNELGRFLLDNFQGKYSAMVEEAGRSAVRMVDIFARMPCWVDISRYGELAAPFMKRAQLATYGIQLAGAPAARFADLPRLTMFADNLIPHVLRLDGLLAFTAGLEQRIEGGGLIPHGSAAEIEIRAAAVHVCEKLSAAGDLSGRQMMPLQIASALWKRGQQQHYKARPRHRSICFAY